MKKITKTAFYFRIEENVFELYSSILNHQHDEKEPIWEVFDGVMYDRNISSAQGAGFQIDARQEALKVFTAWSNFIYYIYNLPEGGAEVFFFGPLNAILNQNLLPKMTYVPKTIKVDKEQVKGLKRNLLGLPEEKWISLDVSAFISIDEYSKFRNEENKKKTNPQDKYGARINSRFNNEINCLPLFK